MIHELELSLPLCEPLFPQRTLPFRLDLFEVELIHDSRDGQSKLGVGDRLSDTAAGTDRERRVGVSGGFDGVFGVVFEEPTLGEK